MKKRKLREKGKIRLSQIFQKINKGDKVMILKNPAIPSSFPDRINGKTGVIEDKRGKACIIKIKDMAKEKTFIIEPIHLKKVK
jgi:ribosomal protein L21E